MHESHVLDDFAHWSVDRSQDGHRGPPDPTSEPRDQNRKGEDQSMNGLVAVGDRGRRARGLRRIEHDELQDGHHHEGGRHHPSAVGS